MTLVEVTQDDIDDLVELADKDPEFKKELQEMDELARIRKCELKEVIQTAVDWFLETYPDQKIE